MPKYMTVTTFGGVDKDSPLIIPLQEGTNPPGANILRQCLNFIGKGDPNNVLYGNHALGNIGFLTKSTSTLTPGSFPAIPSSRNRGMHQFWHTYTRSSSNWDSFLVMCVNTSSANGKILAIRIGNSAPYDLYTLSTIAAGYASHADFVNYGGKVYIAFNKKVYKWNGDTTNWATVCPEIRDKGGVATAIAGAVLTWNGTATVTSDIDISALLTKGDWIRRSSTSPYWDEILTIAAGGLTITLSAASSDTGASAAGGAQKAPLLSSSHSTYTPYFMKAWKGKLWLISMALNNTVAYSVTGNFEDFTSTGSGTFEVGDGNYDEVLTGVATLENMIFFFREKSTYIHRWTGDVDEPVELVNVLAYGSASHRTLKSFNNGLAYYTGNDLRFTNGNNDMSLGGPMKEWFINNGFGMAMPGIYFEDGASNDNLYPFAVLEPERSLYKLCFPSQSALTVIFNYNYEKGVWVGIEAKDDMGMPVMFDWGSGGTLPRLLFTPVSAVGTAIKEHNPFYIDYNSTGELVSATFFSGIEGKKIKVNWVEFVFHPITGADSTITFNYYKDFAALAAGGPADSNKNQTYDLSYSGTNGQYIATKKFQVNDVCDYFAWYLSETKRTGATPSQGIGIVSWTMCYDLLDS